jgi:hypothetical protein
LRGTQEAYAHARACFHKPTEAARIAGFSDRSGQCSKYERNRKVQARIAYLAREPEATTKAKREEIEKYLWFALRADRSVFFDENRHLRPFAEVEPEYRQLIEGLTFTEKGKPNLKLMTQSFALVELRKFLGLDAPTKIAPTTPDGTESYAGGLANLTDEQLAKLNEAHAIIAGAAGEAGDRSGD